MKEHVSLERSEEVDHSFEKSEQLLREAGLLVHFDPNFQVKLTCDASEVGIAPALSHAVNGDERPIRFASQKRTSAQMLYPQIEQEGLAIIFGLDKSRHVCIVINSSW